MLGELFSIVILFGIPCIPKEMMVVVDEEDGTEIYCSFVIAIICVVEMVSVCVLWLHLGGAG